MAEHRAAEPAVEGEKSFSAVIEDLGVQYERSRAFLDSLAKSLGHGLLRRNASKTSEAGSVVTDGVKHWKQKALSKKSSTSRVDVFDDTSADYESEPPSMLRDNSADEPRPRPAQVCPPLYYTANCSSDGSDLGSDTESDCAQVSHRSLVHAALPQPQPQPHLPAPRRRASTESYHPHPIMESHARNGRTWEPHPRATRPALEVKSLRADPLNDLPTHPSCAQPPDPSRAAPPASRTSPNPRPRMGHFQRLLARFRHPNRNSSPHNPLRASCPTAPGELEDPPNAASAALLLTSIDQPLLPTPTLTAVHSFTANRARRSSLDFIPGPPSAAAPVAAAWTRRSIDIASSTTNGHSAPLPQPSQPPTVAVALQHQPSHVRRQLEVLGSNTGPGFVGGCAAHGAPPADMRLGHAGTSTSRRRASMSTLGLPAVHPAVQQQQEQQQEQQRLAPERSGISCIVQARSRSSSTLPFLRYPSPGTGPSPLGCHLDHSPESPWTAAAAAAAAGPGVGCGGGGDACRGMPPRARRDSSVVRPPAGQQAAGPIATHGSVGAHGHGHGHGHVPYPGASGATVTRRRSDRSRRSSTTGGHGGGSNGSTPNGCSRAGSRSGSSNGESFWADQGSRSHGQLHGHGHGHGQVAADPHVYGSGGVGVGGDRSLPCPGAVIARLASLKEVHSQHGRGSGGAAPATTTQHDSLHLPHAAPLSKGSFGSAGGVFSSGASRKQLGAMEAGAMAPAAAAGGGGSGGRPPLPPGAGWHGGGAVAGGLPGGGGVYAGGAAAAAAAGHAIQGHLLEQQVNSKG